ncbi:MAG TPA: SRPBCC family protein [Planctomycetota bacterium]|nr:SRPBCC family protein [Planctomycetota bacterium]
MSKLTVAAQGDREIVMSRVLRAPREDVFDAFTKPELLKRWLFGPDGWELAICEIDLRVGGRYRYVWRKLDGGFESTIVGDIHEMGMGGVYREVKRPARIVATEKFDQAWYPGEALGTITFVEKDGRTTVTQTMRYESKEARDGVLRSPMEEGVAAGYERLARIVER